MVPPGVVAAEYLTPGVWDVEPSNEELVAAYQEATPEDIWDTGPTFPYPSASPPVYGSLTVNDVIELKEADLITKTEARQYLITYYGATLSG